MTNAVDGNAILAFSHRPLQGLVLTDSIDTGGNGTGSGLGNQGGVILSRRHRWLYDAGSDSISVFRVHRNGLTRVETVDSGGVQPSARPWPRRTAWPPVPAQAARRSTWPCRAGATTCTP